MTTKTCGAGAPVTTVELGRVRPLCRCGHSKGSHDYNQGWLCEDCGCEGHHPPQDWPRGFADPNEHFAHRAPSPRPVVAQLLKDVAAGLRVLNTRDAADLTEAQIEERARNIVAGLLGNYRIERIEP